MSFTEGVDISPWVVVCGKGGTWEQQFLSILPPPSWGHLLAGNIFIPE